MDDIKKHIKAAIKAKGYTQTVLARRLRCSLPFLCMVISGKKTSKRIRAGLAAYLGKSVSDLWPEPSQPQQESINERAQVLDKVS